MFLYGILRSAIEKIRTDSLIIPFTHLKISEILAIALSLTFLAIIIKKFLSKYNTAKQ